MVFCIEIWNDVLSEILVTGRRNPPSFVLDTETQREYQNPNAKSIEQLKHVEENRHGRYAYSPNQSPPNGICKSLNMLKALIFLISFSTDIQCKSIS